ncbi:MAG TPA: polysaccharide lyase family protein [Clostridia bacterium]|nr:polysaccharide lyase family protein [Clostridia bacterium]
MFTELKRITTQSHSPMMTRTRKCLASLALWAAASTLAAAAGETIVWQIGQPDKTYAEFAIARNYPAFQDRFGRQPLVFEPGRSDAARDWPFIQPGPADAWAGSRPHPFTIRFNLPEAPRGAYTLKVELVDVQAGNSPMLRVKVGERTGLFPLQSGGGDGSLSNPALGRNQKVELGLPASFLRQGVNEIELTSMEGAWLLYDAVTLANDPEANTTAPAIQSLSIEPTPFYLRENGKVRRALNLKVVPSAPSAKVTLRVAARGETIEIPVTGLAGPDGYSQQVTVPDSPKPFAVTITANAGGPSKSTTLQVQPGPKWKIYVAASAHTDIGYTDIQPKCAERHNENTDVALSLMEKYPDFKWNLEVAWQAEIYLEAREGEQRERFLRYAKEGRLGIQALYCNLLTGLSTHEAGCRLTWVAHNLKNKYGIPYRSAMISDVPTQEASLPMLLANAGIRYFSSGINNDRAYPFNEMQQQSPCWWEGPDGSRVLMFYASMYAQASGMGLDHSLEAATSRIQQHLLRLQSRTNYPYDATFFHGGVGDNSQVSPRLIEVVRAWNERYEAPKIILSHNSEFFEYIEKRYGDQLPTFRGSAGGYWEDGAASSAAETALCRKAKETIGTAEQYLAFARHLQPQAEYPVQDIYNAWRNSFLYDEHTWGAHCSISQPDSEFSKAQWKIKAQFALDAEQQANALMTQASSGLASMVKADGRSLVVFNPASWTRTDVLQVKLPPGTGIAEPGVAMCEDGDQTLVLVKDVPASGYRVLKLGAQAAPAPQSAEGTTLESAFYRVKFDPANGAVISLFDKELNRELVDPQAPYQLNQYLYVAGGEGTRIVMNPRNPEPNLTISTPEKATLRRVRLGGLGERMIIESSAVMAPQIVTEVTVWNHLRRVDIVNRLNKTQTYKKEAVYFAFPFAAKKPTFRYECPAGIVNANTDMLPGACLDWFAVQHFVEIESGDAAIAWATPDAPLVCFQDINRGKWLRELPMHTGHLYAYVMNNYWHTNYKPGQGGEHVFRFSITSRAKADNTASAQFGWAASNPLLAVPVEGNAGGSLPSGSASLVQIDEPNVLLIGAKQAENGKGLILRLWETSGKSTTAHVRLNQLPARRASACNLVEEPQGKLKIKGNVLAVPVRGSGLATVLVQ